MSTSYKFDEKKRIESIGGVHLSQISDTDGVEGFANKKGQQAREREKQRIKSLQLMPVSTQRSRKEQNRKTNMAHSKKAKAKQEALVDASVALEVAEHGLRKEEKAIDQSLSEIFSYHTHVMSMKSAQRQTRP